MNYVESIIMRNVFNY